MLEDGSVMTISFCMTAKDEQMKIIECHMVFIKDIENLALP